MRVEELLRSKGTRIDSVRADESVDTALRVMRSNNVGALVIKDVCHTEGDTVMGIISERDVVAALVDRGPAVLKRRVETLMSSDFVTCRPADSLRHVLELMDRHFIRHIPVFDGLTLIGVVSVRDLIKLQLNNESTEAGTAVLAAAQ